MTKKVQSILIVVLIGVLTAFTTFLAFAQSPTSEPPAVARVAARNPVTSPHGAPSRPSSSPGSRGSASASTPGSESAPTTRCSRASSSGSITSSSRS